MEMQQGNGFVFFWSALQGGIMYIDGAFMKELYLAGGPYYGLQEVFSRIRGVARVRAGFANCSSAYPSKEDIYSGKAEGRECIQVIYNPKKIDIVSLLSLFFTIINPYTDGIQGKAVGPQFRSGVYYTSHEDTMQISYYLIFLQNRGQTRRMTDASIVFNEFEGEGRRRPKIRTEMKPLVNFYEAPEEEQYYLRKHPDTYTPINIPLLEELGTIGKAPETLQE